MHFVRRLFEHLKQDLSWFRHKRILNSMIEMEHFHDYILEVRPKEFLRYQEASPQKRLEFESVINELGMKLKGMKFLDIGPGYGDSLDICHEEGVKCIEFVEIDPFFFTYNRLKGYAKGYPINHLMWLSRLYPMKYDFVWVKGSVSADRFTFMSKKLRIKYLSLSRWLTQLEKLASSTCQIIICPHWSNDTKKRNIEDIQHNVFTTTMLERGYAILPKIRNHNDDPGYPITFYKNMSRTSPNSN